MGCRAEILHVQIVPIEHLLACVVYPKNMNPVLYSAIQRVFNRKKRYLLKNILRTLNAVYVPQLRTYSIFRIFLVCTGQNLVLSRIFLFSYRIVLDPVLHPNKNHLLSSGARPGKIGLTLWYNASLQVGSI
jgi:hypothetical protein